MSNPRTGLYSALGSLLGGVAGATAGFYANKLRAPLQIRGGRLENARPDDVMVVGAAAGAALGAFIAGSVAGEKPAQLGKAPIFP